MSTSLKKLLLVVFTLFLGVTSSGAMADTNYNFNFNSGSVVGVLVVDNSNMITYIINGTISGIEGYNGPIELIAPGGVGGNDNQYYPSVSGPYLDGSGISFSTSGTSGNLNLYYGDGVSDYLLSNGDQTLAEGSMTSSISGGIAPEMNASLIPQVGLLLGCLFFLFGRKTEVVEPMLAA